MLTTIDPNVEKVFEATTNVHVPSLKCSYFSGTRFYVKNNTVSTGMQETPLSNDFLVLVRNGIMKELTETEAAKPEKVVEPKVIKMPERKKMRVEIQDTQITSIADKIQKVRKAPVQGVDATDEVSAEVEQPRTVRGMKVITTETTDLKKPEDTQSKAKEISPEKLARIEAIKKARLEAVKKAQQARKANAAKARAERSAARVAEKADNSTGTAQTDTTVSQE